MVGEIGATWATLMVVSMRLGPQIMTVLILITRPDMESIGRVPIRLAAKRPESLHAAQYHPSDRWIDGYGMLQTKRPL